MAPKAWLALAVDIGDQSHPNMAQNLKILVAEHRLPTTGFYTKPLELGALQGTAHCRQIGLGLAAAASGCCKPLVDLNGSLAGSLPMLHVVELRLRKLNAHAGNERSSDNTKLEPRTRLLTPAPDK